MKGKHKEKKMGCLYVFVCLYRGGLKGVLVCFVAYDLEQRRERVFMRIVFSKGHDMYQSALFLTPCCLPFCELQCFWQF